MELQCKFTVREANNSFLFLSSVLQQQLVKLKTMNYLLIIFIHLLIFFHLFGSYLISFIKSCLYCFSFKLVYCPKNKLTCISCDLKKHEK